MNEIELRRWIVRTLWVCGGVLAASGVLWFVVGIEQNRGVLIIAGVLAFATGVGALLLGWATDSEGGR